MKTRNQIPADQYFREMEIMDQARERPRSLGAASTRRSNVLDFLDARKRLRAAQSRPNQPNAND